LDGKDVHRGRHFEFAAFIACRPLVVRYLNHWCPKSRLESSDKKSFGLLACPRKLVKG